MHVGDLLSIFAAPYTSNLIPVWNVPNSEIFSNSSKTSNCRGWINASLISKKVNRQKGQFGGRRNGIIVSFPINQVQRTQHRRYDVGLWFECAFSAGTSSPLAEGPGGVIFTSCHWMIVRRIACNSVEYDKEIHGTTPIHNNRNKRKYSFDVNEALDLSRIFSRYRIKMCVYR